MNPFLRRYKLIHLCFIVFLVNSSARGADSNGITNAVDQAIRKYKMMSLEELLDQPVTTVTKTPERVSGSPASIEVITGEDIRRSGATSLPEALRLAFNLQVAQVNSHDWAITARGFNGAPLSNNTLADKLLVMIDGRSVYTPLFGGVFWDAQNVLLEDIDRIEVVSGPGGTLWGANAVNGIINIVTKSAKDTQGLYASGAGGSFLQDYGAVRYGGGNGTNLFYRVYAQRFDRNSTKFQTGADVGDDWDLTQGGFRVDYYPADANTLTLQGDFYGGDEDAPDKVELNGQNVLFRWTRAFSEESDLSVQMYFDRTWRNLPFSASVFREEQKTYDFDFQHRFPIGERQSVLWGAGYRLIQDDVNAQNTLTFFSPHRNMELFTGFLQDEIAILPEELKLTLGTKLERNDFSGLEIQPSARIAWTPTRRQTLWAAVSRTVRSPSRFDVDILTPDIAGNSDFAAEKAIAYEVGYRIRPIEKLSLSLAAFYNRYSDLRTVNTVATPPPPFMIANSQRAETWGLELAGNLQAADWWRVRAGYTYLHENFSATSANAFSGSDTFEAIDPHHQFMVQSIMDLPKHFQLDLAGRYVHALDSTVLTPRVPAYFTFDARIAWQYRNWELSVVGQNLLDNQHPEFGSLEIPRSVYGKITWRF